MSPEPRPHRRPWAISRPTGRGARDPRLDRHDVDVPLRWSELPPPVPEPPTTELRPSYPAYTGSRRSDRRGPHRRPGDPLDLEPGRLEPRGDPDRWAGSSLPSVVLLAHERPSTSSGSSTRRDVGLVIEGAGGDRLGAWSRTSTWSPGSAAGPAVCLRAELAADDVRAQRERGRLVEGDRPRHALAAEAAVGRQHEVLRVDVLERAADVRGDLLGRLDLQRPMADEADGDLLLELALVRREARRGVVGVLRLDRPDVAP